MKVKIDADADNKSSWYDNYKLTIPITGDLNIEKKFFQKKN